MRPAEAMPARVSKQPGGIHMPGGKYQVEVLGVSGDIRSSLMLLAPTVINATVRYGLSVGDRLISWAFGNAALQGKFRAEFDAKRKLLDDVLHNKLMALRFKGIPLPAGAPPTAVMRAPIGVYKQGDAQLRLQIDVFENGMLGEVMADRNVFNRQAGGSGVRTILTVIHELSHAILNTTDYPLGPNGGSFYGNDAAQLALQSTEAALKNAENWGMFYAFTAKEDAQFRWMFGVA
jgi:hypothetical protein